MSGSGNHYNGKFDPKSWVVNLRHGQIVVEQSYFVPGYTSAHYDTKAAAIMHAMSSSIDAAEVLKKQIETLSTMLEDEMMAQAKEVLKSGPIDLDDLDG